jgi:hypothetical protein
MNPSRNDSPQILVVDGDVAKLLRIVQEHTNIEKATLIHMAAKLLPTDEAAFSVLEKAVTCGFVIESHIGIMLTEVGQEWLASEGQELFVELEDEETEGLPPQRPYDVAKLNMETRNMSVYQALRKIENNQINLQPDFQRAFVWDEVRQSRLIESILIRIPLPAFYLDATDQTNWNVVDGLQRLTTLFNYCRKRAFKLRGLQFLSELENLSFEELPTKYQVLIEDDTQLLFYNLMPGTPIQAKFTIFSRVNTGGMQLLPQEIRHALNQGPATRLLADLAQNTIFRTVTKGVVDTLRMGDRELILRVLAFMHLGFLEYRKFNELESFLVYAMEELNHLPEIQMKTLASDFLQSLQKVDALFGRYAFRKFYAIDGRRSPFNKALFEVWTTTVRNYTLPDLMSNRDEILNGFVELVNFSETFSRSISSSTSSFTAVSNRFGYIEELLRNSIGRGSV